MATSWWFESTQPHHFKKSSYCYTRSWRNWQTRYFEGVVFTRRMGSSPIDRTMEKEIPGDLPGIFIFPVVFGSMTGEVIGITGITFTAQRLCKDQPRDGTVVFTEPFSFWKPDQTWPWGMRAGEGAPGFSGFSVRAARV